MNTKDKFAGVKALRPATRRVVGEPRGERAEVAEASGQLAMLLGAAVRSNRYGEHLALRRWFDEPSAFEPRADSLRLLAPDAPEEAGDPDKWLFLDTETTGLSGGSGTYAFLVGIAWWDAGGLEVEQFFMRDHSEEHSVLLALRERMAERPVLVTFNGKSFDWPLLETRYRMTRAIAPRKLAAHLDILHPARQLWRLRLGTARLPDLEKHVLGWERGVDVQSELIPQIYFDFLRGGPAEPLVPIFKHNQMDLRGLAALAARVFSVLGAPQQARCDALELYGVSRILTRRGEFERARELYAQTLDAGLADEIDRSARRELARLAKRGRDYALATSLWEELSATPRGNAEAIEALVELAIHYEHRGRDSAKAAQATREALAHLLAGWRRKGIRAERYRTLRGKLEHRLERLTRKASHSLPLRIGRAEAGGEAEASNQQA
ncbi:MAG TPA: ribonuclease H-like domain-containing protein [Candidatus Acidoferrales bacterium]|nr:ribonuclease H-like domain-containing protein [Candidatus Acidoferrales bacterium]